MDNNNGGNVFTEQELKSIQESEQVRAMTQSSGWKIIESLLNKKITTYTNLLLTRQIDKDLQVIEFYIGLREHIKALNEVLTTIKNTAESGLRKIEKKEGSNA